MENNQVNAVTVSTGQNTVANFTSSNGFEFLQRISNMFAKSDLVPASFKNNVSNCAIGVELAQRIGASPLMVMQNLDIIHGRPSWRSQFIIASINSSGRFSPLRYRFSGEGDKRSCSVWCTDKSGEVLEGPGVSIQMAKDEGWYGRNGSKWKSMPDLMLSYRAAAFFGRLYAPEILMGMPTAEESEDIGANAVDVTPSAAVSDLNAAIAETASKKRSTRSAKAVASAHVIESTAEEVVDNIPTTPVDDSGDDANTQTDTSSDFF